MWSIKDLIFLSASIIYAGGQANSFEDAVERATGIWSKVYTD